MLFFLLACSGEEKDQTSYRPPETESFISNDLLDTFENFGLPLHYGDNPPDISGTYLFREPDIIYNNSEYWPNPNNSWCEFHFTFQSQGESIYTLDAEGITCNAYSSGQEYYISGTDSCFTLYGKSTGTFEGCETETIRLISACLDSNGDMDNPIMGRTNTYVENSSSCDNATTEGGTLQQDELAIYGFEDGIARKQ